MIKGLSLASALALTQAVKLEQCCPTCVTQCCDTTDDNSKHEEHDIEIAEDVYEVLDQIDDIVPEILDKAIDDTEEPKPEESEPDTQPAPV